MSGLLDTVGDLLGVGADSSATPSATGRRTTTEAPAPGVTGGLGVVPILLPDDDERQSGTGTARTTGRATTTTTSVADATGTSRPAEAQTSSSSPPTNTTTSTSETETSETETSETPTSEPSPATDPDPEPSPTPAPAEPTSSESIIPSFETSAVPDATPPAIDPSSQAQVDGGGMDQRTTMVIAISAPIAAVSIIGLGVLIWWSRKRKAARRRDSEPYDEEFQSLKSKHEKKFGVGHNY